MLAARTTVRLVTTANMAASAAMTNASDKSRQPSPTIALPQTAEVAWLLRSATVSATASAMLAELCNRLVDEDLPIIGAQLTVTSLGPMVARGQIRWRRGDARIAEEIHFQGMFHKG
jgi:hypothetical protein